MGFRILILLFYLSSIYISLSYQIEYCTEKYEPNTNCMVQFLCDRTFSTGHDWTYFRKDEDSYQDGYSNCNYIQSNYDDDDDDDHHHHHHHIQSNYGFMMKPIHLTIRNLVVNPDVNRNTNENDYIPPYYSGDDQELLRFVVVLDIRGNAFLHNIGLNAQMSRLKKLKISNTILDHAKLSDNDEFSSLEELDLSFNQIQDIYGVQNEKPFRHLKKINLSNNKLESVKLSNIIEFEFLEELDFSSNQIQEVKYFEYEYPFNSLKKINLSYNNLESVPNLEKFHKLEDIDISHNNVEALKDITFEGIKDLKILNLSNNRISEINSSLFRFTKLRILNLKFNKIDHINTKDFSSLVSLEILDLSSNFISSLDRGVFNGMMSLQELNMRDNEIVEIDKETFTDIPSLKFVDLSANKIKSLPKDLFRGKNIQNFSIEENLLEISLTRGMFDGLTYVSNLDLSYQFVDTIEDLAFYGLDGLKDLLLQHNNIKNLSLKCFGTLKNLKKLDLSFNKISEIIFEKQDLYSLETFILKNNHLTTVNSNNFNGMTSLRYLDLTNNKINHIEPNSFQSLLNLVNFEISNNPLDGVLNDGTFEGLKSLPKLDISSTSLMVIQNNSFCGMTNLISLNVSHSKINTVQFNAFSQTGSLYSIDLSFNQISEFYINTTDMPHLGAIYINNNNIKFLPSSLFLNVSQLSILMLSFNKMQDISPSIFSDPNNLEIVDFSYNKNLNINTSLVNNMKKIKFLSLSGINKEISFVDIDIPVTELVLSNSSIKDVGSLHLNTLKQLDTMVLSHNNITKLEHTAFANISSLKNLDVSYNSITYIQPATFKDNSLLVSLNISHNLLNALAYGTLTGLINLNTIDVSYNHISSLQNERFYETSNLQVLIVDYNNIESFAPDDFQGTELSVVSLGNNPIACEKIVNFNKNKELYNFEITAITLDTHNDENVHGIICNKNNHDFSRASKYFTNTNANSFSSYNDSVLINIRDILLDRLKTQSNENKDTNNDKHFLNYTDKFNKFAESNNEKLEKIMENNEKLVNLTSQNLNAVQYNTIQFNSSINRSDKTNLLLEKIYRILSNKSSTTAPLTKDNATYVNLVEYINKIKQEIEDDISFEKRNIIDEVDSKILNLKSNNMNASLLTSKMEHLEQKSSTSEQSVFTETCVAFILVILVVILLFLVYKSGIFVRKSFSISTRELPSAMDSTL